MLGEVALLSGRVNQAEEELFRAVKLHETARALSGLSLSLERVAKAQIASGRPWRARRLLPRALSLAERTELVSHIPVRVYGTMIEAAEDAGRGAKIVQVSEGELAGREVCEPCSMGYRVAASIALARVGDTHGARRHLDEAERIAGMWQGGPWLAAVWEGRGALRLAQGDPAQAAALFREAATLFDQTGRPVDAARCLEAAAGMG